MIWTFDHTEVLGHSDKFAQAQPCAKCGEPIKPGQTAAVLRQQTNTYGPERRLVHDGTCFRDRDLELP